MKFPMMKVLAALLLAVLLFGLVPVSALAATQSAFVIGNSYTLGSGQTVNDDLVIFGGSARLENGSTINGNVFLAGGSLYAAGTVNGDITALGGTVSLASTFVLHGNLSMTGTAFTQDPAAQITGQVETGQGTPNVTLPGGIKIIDWTSGQNLFLRIVGFFFGLALWTLVAMIAGMFAPNYLDRISQAGLTQPLISGGLGLLTAIVVPVVLVLLAITICLIPVSLLGILVLVVAWATGIIAVGLEVGKRIAIIFKQSWHPALAAGAGTLLLMGVLNGLESIVPCIGWIPLTIVGFIGLGAVLLTQFGMKTYTPNPGTPGVIDTARSST